MSELSNPHYDLEKSERLLQLSQDPVWRRGGQIRLGEQLPRYGVAQTDLLSKESPWHFILTKLLRSGYSQPPPNESIFEGVRGLHLVGNASNRIDYTQEAVRYACTSHFREEANFYLDQLKPVEGMRAFARGEILYLLGDLQFNWTPRHAKTGQPIPILSPHTDDADSSFGEAARSYKIALSSGLEGAYEPLLSSLIEQGDISTLVQEIFQRGLVTEVQIQQAKLLFLVMFAGGKWVELLAAAEFFVERGMKSLLADINLGAPNIKDKRIPEFEVRSRFKTLKG